jgi:hypothetical protein
MPDLATHVLAVAPFLRKRVPRPEVVLLGAVLPDLAGRLGILLPDGPFFVWMDMALHTPAAIALVIYILALIFPREARREAAVLLGAGAAAHFALDVLQKSVAFGNIWLFPLSMKSFQIPLFWSDESLYAVPVLIAVNLVVFRRPILERLGGRARRGRGAA